MVDGKGGEVGCHVAEAGNLWEIVRELSDTCQTPV